MIPSYMVKISDLIDFFSQLITLYFYRNLHLGSIPQPLESSCPATSDIR